VKIIFAGALARDPLGGSVWARLQYILGLRRLGHDVYFLEESGDIPYLYDVHRMEESNDPVRAGDFVEAALRRFGLEDRWIYRAGNICLGMSVDEVRQLCCEADLLVVWPCDLWCWRPEYDAIPIRALIDIDPGFTQFRALRGDWPIAGAVAHCNVFFTYAHGLNEPDSPIPDLGCRWHSIWPPVYLEEWPVRYDPRAVHFTTVMSWSQDPSPEYQGATYGQKDVELEGILDLPKRLCSPLQIAVSDGPTELLFDHGWRVISALDASRDPDTYRDYIQKARGEFSVAKNGYVMTQCGWVSDRTAVFLASGKPAVVQETGMSRWLPTGEGLLTFDDADEAVTSVERVNTDYHSHCLAARRIAEEWFDSDHVLTNLLETVGA
jgi:hypothetical protein